MCLEYTAIARVRRVWLPLGRLDAGKMTLTDRRLLLETSTALPSAMLAGDRAPSDNSGQRAYPAPAHETGYHIRTAGEWTVEEWASQNATRARRGGLRDLVGALGQ